MFHEEINSKIKQLESELSAEQERYITSVKEHRNYTTLRSIRDKIHRIKSELEQLYPQYVK